MLFCARSNFKWQQWIQIIHSDFPDIESCSLEFPLSVNNEVTTDWCERNVSGKASPTPSLTDVINPF